MSLHIEERIIPFRKENFTVQYHFYLCEDSNDQFTTTELDELNIAQVNNQYRAAHRLPFPEEIISTRKKYGLHASKMSEVMGFGANSYRNYEKGEVPSESNARLIQLAQHPREFHKLLELSKASLPPETYNKAVKKIAHLLSEEQAHGFQSSWENYLISGSSLPDEFTGYRKPDFERLTEMIVYFAGKLSPYKTRLNKLLFYADFSHFRTTGYSISGAQYVAIKMGPVPNNFSSLFAVAEKKQDIDILYAEFASGQTSEQFIPYAGRQFRTGLFSETEIACLEKVVSTFDRTSTQEIIRISHQEKAWKENEATKSRISYQKYGFDLKGL